MKEQDIKEVDKAVSKLLKLKAREKELQEEIRGLVIQEHRRLIEAKDHNGLVAMADRLKGASVATFFYSEAYKLINSLDNSK